MTQPGRAIVMASLVSLAFLPVLMPRDLAAAEPEGARTGPPPGRSLLFFGGLTAQNSWEDIFSPGKLRFEDATLLGLAFSQRLATYWESLDLELEGQVVRHLGNQDHWTLNLPLVLRWRSFPWDHVVETGVAWGIGPSLASEVPRLEVVRDGESQRALVYWLAEIELGPPKSDWSAVLRLHHRSGAFGLVADKGGANALVGGIRWRF